jgi:hypothetical protein
MDFLTSYGVALVIITAALIVVINVALNPPADIAYTSPPGLTMDFIGLNTSGAVVVKLSQSLGSQITINGVACSSRQSSTGNNPAYGNTAVNSLGEYYPTVYYSPGNVVYLGTYAIVSAYCYKAGNARAYGNLGSTFTGYLWINYSVPGYAPQIEEAASFTAPYLSTYSIPTTSTVTTIAS